MTKYFWLGTEVLFIKIILHGHFGKIKYYAIRIEFPERSSPHIHSFIWIFNAPNIENEAAI